jgi:hypothetical protein
LARWGEGKRGVELENKFSVVSFLDPTSKSKVCDQVTKNDNSEIQRYVT